jgi:flagellar basal-body rod modification protein FlgD
MKERTQMNIQGMLSPIVARAMDSSSSTSGSSATNSSNSSTASGSNTELSQSSFLQLIATELQAQDPTNPLDPSQFMGQLVQFDTLDQVTGIYNLLAGGSSATAGSGAATPAGSVANSSAVQNY